MAATLTAKLEPTAPAAGISTRRRLTNRLWWTLCVLGLALVVLPVVWILVGVIQRGVDNWHWTVLTQVSTGIGGGLSNAITGTLVLMLGVFVIAGVVGIGCGVFLAEILRSGPAATVLRSAFEILAGIPSIVFGYVGYLALVLYLHWSFSLLAALIVLSALVVPYIAKATELSLSQVPLAYREGGEALGMKRTHLLRRVVLRSAVPGIATGLIIALAISVGETAPLLYTAGWSNGYPTAQLIHQPIGYLTYAVYTFYDDPSSKVQGLSYEAALIVVVLVLVLILLSRLVVRLTQKYAPNRATGGERRARRQASASAS